MNVLIDDTYASHRLSRLPLNSIVSFVLYAQNLPENTEVSISFVSNDTIHELNRAYRSIDAPTDVLSFECDCVESLHDTDPNDVFVLGDVIIAPDVAALQARDHATSFEDEITLLLVHGILHLCGFDHQADQEAQIMESREKYLLHAMNDLWKEHPACDSFIDAQCTTQDQSAFDEEYQQSHPFSFSQALVCAQAGIVYMFKTQRNSRIHAIFALCALLLCFMLGCDQTEFLAVIVCIALVFSLELVNTSIEVIVDYISPSKQNFARDAKDCAAGAVLFASICSLVVGLVIFIPKIINLFV